ncbi:hypothetical protein QBC46DRAFT_381543 [Diplogelasinospora grovesii]|uniref:Uncharacterized protein n=1 Tax=Diplogelasinospora grovesii TaxID=303347 RepID=A0AAN6N9S7_9PEZI|nr:hypothetical protein QBC46DRAFT_381543 [Diplogelasinospora grovesii]
MGGLAFSSEPYGLYTPRMPPAVYRRVRAMVHAALREVFVYVATPIEGPSKADHGDVDVLVALEKQLAFPNTPGDHLAQPAALQDLRSTIKNVLHAEHVIVNGPSVSMAIPWLSSYGEADGVNGDARSPYIQVDVRICRDVDKLSWVLFKHAHGDIWNLVGSTIRPFGLTVEEEAMWLRIPEIEALDRKKARVFLTNDPAEVLHFLGMKAEGFWEEPFASVDALFEYAATCRLFRVRMEASHDNADANAGPGLVGGEEGRKQMKHNDRQRMRFRPVYQKWNDEFIPRLRAEGRFMHEDEEDGQGQDNTTTDTRVRDRVRKEAFERFPHAEKDYRDRLREWRLKRQSDEVWRSTIKGSIPTDLDPQYRSCLAGALKKIIMGDDMSFGIAPPTPLRTPDGFYDEDAIRAFIQEHWQVLGLIALKRQHEKMAEAMQQQKKRKASPP